MLVENRRDTKVKAAIESNRGSKLVKEEAEAFAYGTVYFWDNALTNICSLSELAKKTRVTFDSKKETAFLVYRKDGSHVKFSCTAKGSYVLQTRDKNWLIRGNPDKVLNQEVKKKSKQNGKKSKRLPRKEDRQKEKLI